MSTSVICEEVGGQVYRKISIPLAAFAMLVAACSSTVRGTSTSTTTTEATAAPTTSAAPTTTAGATSSTTSTTVAGTTTTVGPDGSFTEPAAVYRVVDVAVNDVLNIRSGPGIDNDIVAEYAPTATDVLTTGRGFKVGSSSDWVEVTTAELTGWVNKRFLEMIDQTSVPLGEVPCSVNADSVGTTPDVWPAPDGESNADNVYAIESVRGGGCSRTVVTLGTNFDWTNLDAALPADRVPADVAGIEGASLVRHVVVDMPTIFRARPSTGAGAAAYLVRSTEGPADEGGQNGLFANVPTGPGVSNVFYLDSPARIVVDHWSIPDGGQPFWPGGTGVVLVNPVSYADQLPVVTEDMQFNGYARGFEASLSAQLFRTDSSQPLEVTWEPASGGDPITATGYVTTVNDWTEAWGQFAFTIPGLEDGVYRLEISTDNAAGSEEFQVLEYEFVVAG